MTDSLTKLLYITPRGPVSAEPTDDELTAAMETAFSTAEVVQVWRGRHTCVCGEGFSNRDYEVTGRYVTNSLCVHYLRWHRAEVPAAELNKVRALAGLPTEDEPDEPQPVTFLGRPLHEWDDRELQQALDELTPPSQRPPWRSDPSRSYGLFQTMPSAYRDRAARWQPDTEETPQ